MENETLGVEVQEVADPAIVTETGAEALEVADPTTSVVEETTTHVEKPHVKDDRDSWFAEKRRELEAKEKEMETKYNTQLETERQRIAELETKTKTYEKKEKYEGLRKQAEEYGLDYEELVAEVEKQEAEEELKAKTIEELNTEKSEKQKLAEEKKQLESDLIMLKMSMEDRDELLAYDSTINLKELSEDFYKLRVNGYPPIKAYKLAQSLKEDVVVAESPGKVNSTQTESDTFSPDEWDGMSKTEQERLMSTNFDKVYKSQMSWLKKK